MTDVTPAPFTMMGDPDAAACEGDACLIPGVAEFSVAEFSVVKSGVVESGVVESAALPTQNGQ